MVINSLYSRHWIAVSWFILLLKMYLPRFCVYFNHLFFLISLLKFCCHSISIYSLSPTLFSLPICCGERVPDATKWMSHCTSSAMQSFSCLGLMFSLQRAASITKPQPLVFLCDIYSHFLDYSLWICFLFPGSAYWPRHSPQQVTCLSFPIYKKGIIIFAHIQSYFISTDTTLWTLLISRITDIS